MQSILKMFKFFTFAFVATLCSAVPSNIDRPCYQNDIKCVRDNLSANSRCNPQVSHFVKNVLNVPLFKYTTPYFNSSYVEHNLSIKNLDKCTVYDFFYDVDKDLSVITLECCSLVLEADRTVLQHYTAAEDSIFHYHFHGTYPKIYLTTNIEHANDMNICNAYTFADVTALPIYHVDPQDRKTANYLTKDDRLLNIYEEETFHVRGKYLSRDFINSFICEFGCRYVYRDDE